jgi:hypothetical protein
VQGYPLELHASTGDVRAKPSGGSAAGAVVPEFIFCRQDGPVFMPLAKTDTLY